MPPYLRRGGSDASPGPATGGDLQRESFQGTEPNYVWRIQKVEVESTE